VDTRVFLARVHEVQNIEGAEKLLQVLRATEMVEAAGIEPASASPRQSGLHA